MTLQEAASVGGLYLGTVLFILGTVLFPTSVA
jgi:hypothetical protein